VPDVRRACAAHGGCTFQRDDPQPARISAINGSVVFPPGGDACSPARGFSPRWFVRGWMQYYGAFYRTALDPLLRRINAYPVRYLRAKYRQLRPLKKALACWQRITGQQPRLFAHWAWMAGFR
jgi:hypothetical protein